MRNFPAEEMQLSVRGDAYRPPVLRNIYEGNSIRHECGTYLETGVVTDTKESVCAEVFPRGLAAQDKRGTGLACSVARQSPPRFEVIC